MSAICLLLSILLNFSNVIGRYFLHHAIIWAEEMMLFLMIASVFFGAAAITLREKRHFSPNDVSAAVTVMVQLMPPRLRIVLDVVAQVTFIITASVLIWLAYPVIAQFVAFGQVSEALRLPVAIPHSVIPIGLFMILAVISRLIERKWRFVEIEAQ